MSLSGEPSTAGSAEPRAVVFDVQRFCVHDGPGLRTVVFFKGCSLGCAWCQNPEAISATPELAYSAGRCLAGCVACLPTCPHDALRDRVDDRVDWSACTHCGACVDVCPTAALEVLGRSVSPAGLLAEVLRDAPFYAASEGGVTLSGGEPVLKSTFLRRFLPLCKEQGLSVAIETAGRYPWRLLEPLLPWLDRVLFDLKVADAERHRALTTRDNGLIHDNLRRLLAAGAAVEVRMPVIPGHNDDGDNVAQTAALLRSLGVGALTLLPYNGLWEAKLPRLCTPRAPLGISAPGGDHYGALADAFRAEGIAARVEGS